MEDSKEEGNSKITPIGRIAKAFKDADKNLEGELRKIRKADTHLTARRKPWKARTRIRWSNKLHSDDDEMDNSTIEINKGKEYTPINPSILSAEKRLYNLRSKKQQENKSGAAYAMSREDFDDVVHFALTQYLLKQGLKKFKKEGESTVKEEFLQLHQKETFQPMTPDELINDQKKGALKLLMFITKKCGRVKLRGCADGRKQR
eukprot:15343367-Ditylum_brightwellii.AAC.1